MYRHLGIVLSIFFSLISTVHAATYYVSTTGDDARSTATAQNIATPWRTATHAAATMSCGDTTLMRAGTYLTETEIKFAQTSCTAGTPVTLQNYPGETVIIDWQVPDNSGSNSAPYTTYQIHLYNGGVGPVTDTHIIGLTLRNAYNCIRNDSGVLRTLFQRNVCDHAFNQGISFTQSGGGLNVTIDGNVIIHAGSINTTACGGVSTCNQKHGMYLVGTGYTITNNVIYDALAYGIQTAGYTTNGTMPSSAYAGFQGVIANNTIGYNRNRAAIVLWDNGGGLSNTTVENNIFFRNNQSGAGSVHAIDAAGSCCTSNVIVRNNNAFGTGTAIATLNNTTITNTTTTDPLMTVEGTTLPGSPDFTLTASSPAIDAGFIDTYPYNGSAPDIGAFETPTFASCVATAAHTISVIFNNNKFPPLLPTSSISGATFKVAGSNNFITSSARNGTNQIDFTVTDAISSGNTVTMTISGGNLTDSALIGGTRNQSYVQTLTDQSCTNTVAGSAAIYTQTVFRFNELRGTEAAPRATPYVTAPESTNIVIIPGGSVRLRFAVTCTVGDCSPIGFFPRYSRNGGGYTIVPDVFTSDNIGFCGTSPDPNIPSSGTATTQQLTGSGTFAPGAIVRTSNAIPTIDLILNGRTEVEYCISVDSDVATTDVFTFRIYKQDGSALDVYTVTPQMSVMANRVGVGF